MPNYENLIKRTIELAKKGAGFVSPNPLVGAVIIKDGEIISEGWHHQHGDIHAEIDAINNCKINDFSDCEIIVNLEPCSHSGKQPPCVDEIIKRKFKKVIIGMSDPNPLVNGQGIKKLQDNGIEVISDVCKDECQTLNRFFIKNITQKKPYITLKIATTLDGYIASQSRKREWITCEESRKEVHKMRAEMDAVLVGRNTVLIDNPRLDARLINGRNPKRLVIDTKLQLPLELYVFVDPNRNQTYIITSKETLTCRKANSLKLSDVNLIPVKVDENQQIDLNAMLDILYQEYKIGSILVEGGATVLTSFINANLMDEIIIYQAPILLGNGLKFYENSSIRSLKDGQKMEFTAGEKSGVDVKLSLRKKIVL